MGPHAGPESIEEIYFEALAIEQPAARSAFLAQRCGGNSDLRARVDRVLAAHAERGRFLDSMALGYTSEFETSAAEGPGASIGPYKLLEEIGEGGMGVVYMAEQTVPVRRRVALKIIKPGMDTRQVVARFEAERQALSLMDHPNIARVLDAGATDSGRPYFVMELVHGMAITDYCDRERLTIDARLALLTLVCRAVQHAHQKGIIHRDLKASNILVTVIDGEAVPKVIDFGVAKATGAALTERTLFTGYHQFIGTPAYMSPEQADLSGVDVDTRSDIYSLGVLLYELLTGTTPVDGATLRQASFNDIRRIVCEEEPPRPSARLNTLSDDLRSTMSVKRCSNPLQLSLLMRGELDWIVMKCLEKDRNRRYESASALAAELQRYLHQEPIEACPPSTLYLFSKFARKHRGAFITGTLVACSLVGGAGISVWQAVEANSARQLADQRADDEKVARELAESNLRRGNEAVDVLLSRVAEERLLDEPHLEGLRRALLTDALRLNGSFLAENPGSPQAQFEVGKAYRRMAEIQDYLGDSQAAADAALQSVRIIDKLFGSFPQDSRYRRELAKSYRILSMSCFNGASVSHQDNLQVHRKALALHEELLRLSPEDTAIQVAVAGACNVLGFEVQAIDADESEALFVRSLSIGTKLLKQNPDDLEVAEHVARTRWFWGRTLHLRRENEQAKQELLLAHSGLAKLLNKSPRTAAFRKAQVEVLNSLARVCAAQSDGEGLNYARQSHTLGEQLVADYPSNDKYRWILYRAREAVAICLESAGELDEAIAERVHLNELSVTTLNPSEADAASAHNYDRIAQLELQRGRHAAAAEALDELLDSESHPHPVLWAAALRFAKCAQLAEYDGAVSSDQRTACVARYVASARKLMDLATIAADYAKRPDDTELLLVLANCQAWLGEDAGLRVTCRRALRHATSTEDPVIAERTAKACSLVPTSKPIEREALLLARQAVAKGQDHDGWPWFQLALGMAEYRNGHFTAALQALDALLPSNANADLCATGSLYRAMSLYRLGNEEESRQLLREVLSMTLASSEDDQFSTHDFLMTCTTLREAMELFGQPQGFVGSHPQHLEHATDRPVE